MLPAVATERQVTKQILVYTWLTVLATLAAGAHATGWLYARRSRCWRAPGSWRWPISCMPACAAVSRSSRCDCSCSPTTTSPWCSARWRSISALGAADAAWPLVGMRRRGPLRGLGPSARQLLSAPRATCYFGHGAVGDGGFGTLAPSTAISVRSTISSSFVRTATPVLARHVRSRRRPGNGHAARRGRPLHVDAGDRPRTTTCHEVIYTQGNTHSPARTIGTRYVATAAAHSRSTRTIRPTCGWCTPCRTRIAVQQDSIGAASRCPDWDPVSQKQVRDALDRALGAPCPTPMACSAAERRRRIPSDDSIGGGGAWGGNPEKDALYLTVEPAAERRHHRAPADGARRPGGRVLVGHRLQQGRVLHREPAERILAEQHRRREANADRNRCRSSLADATERRPTACRSRPAGTTLCGCTGRGRRSSTARGSSRSPAGSVLGHQHDGADGLAALQVAWWACSASSSR